MSSWWPQSSQRSPAATKSKITPHYALWSAAACCRFGCGWKCSIALKAQASLRTPKKSHKKCCKENTNSQRSTTIRSNLHLWPQNRWARLQSCRIPPQRGERSLAGGVRSEPPDRIGITIRTRAGVAGTPRAAAAAGARWSRRHGFQGFAKNTHPWLNSSRSGAEKQIPIGIGTL